MNGNSCTAGVSWYGEMFTKLLSSYNAVLVFIGTHIATANQITIGRGILAIPAFCLWEYGSPEEKSLAIIILTICWIGDYLDGAVARATGQVSPLGKSLDPITDKSMVYGAFCVLREDLYIPNVVIMLILDIISTFSRSKQDSKNQGANIFGKLKTVFQVANNLAVAVGRRYGIETLIWIGGIFLIIAIIFATISVCKRTQVLQKMQEFCKS